MNRDSALICPHMGTRSTAGQREPGIEYPSFENVCFAPPNTAHGHQEPILLVDQATFCVGQGYQLCPRYQDKQESTISDGASNGAEMFPDLDDEIELNNFAPTALMDEPGPTTFPWATALALAALILLLGGSFSLYAGWQLATQGTLDLSARLNRLAASPTATSGPLFVVVTATSAPVAIAGATPISPSPTPTFDFPEAVTPTPAVGGVALGPVVITTPTPTPDAGQDLATTSLATAVAAPVLVTTPDQNLTFATPTRRALPIGQSDVAANLPEPAATPTPTGPLPTPEVKFGVTKQSVIPGECTTVTWDVHNVQAVFYRNEGVPGKGERRECPRWQAETYSLAVVFLDGTEETHSITVDLVPHTQTPSPTPTFTPVLTPTPSWTPEDAAVATPVPLNYGVELSVDGGNQRDCSAGQICEIVLQLFNSGDMADELFLNLVLAGPWPAQLCRSDGLCGQTVVSTGVGPGSSLPIFLKVSVPPEASGQTAQYQLQADSGNAGHGVKSGPITLAVTVP